MKQQPTVSDATEQIAYDAVYADLLRARALFEAERMQPHQRLLSPHCGLHDEHAPACRSAICECDCHFSSNA